MKRLYLIISLVLIVLLCSCQNIAVANYDSQTDRMLTNTQQRVDLLFNKLNDNLHTPQAKYRYYQADYQAIETKLNVLLTRSQAIADNEATTQQISILINSIKVLQQRHKQGFSNAAELQQLQKLIDDQFGSILTLELAKPKN